MRIAPKIKRGDIGSIYTYTNLRKLYTCIQQEGFRGLLAYFRIQNRIHLHISQVQNQKKVCIHHLSVTKNSVYTYTHIHTPYTRPHKPHT